LKGSSLFSCLFIYRYFCINRYQIRLREKLRLKNVQIRRFTLQIHLYHFHNRVLHQVLVTPVEDHRILHQIKIGFEDQKESNLIMIQIMIIKILIQTRPHLNDQPMIQRIKKI